MKIRNAISHFWGTVVHKFWVMWYAGTFCVRVLWRAVLHDWSKFHPKEFSGFANEIDKLRTLTYGSDEYKESLKRLGPSLQHHYEVNRHHPEHYVAHTVKRKGDKTIRYENGGIMEMNLVDFVEMWLDWNAAVRRHNNGKVGVSIDTNAKRYHMSSALVRLLRNTVRDKR